MMSPYAFHQFWLNAEDAKVGELLRIFTFLGHDEIEELRRRPPSSRSCARASGVLAEHVTALVHGDEETEHDPRPRPRAVRPRRPGGLPCGTLAAA